MAQGRGESEEQTSRPASGPEVWVRPEDRAWLLQAGLERASRPEQLVGAEVLSRRGRGASILIRGPQRVLLAKTLRHGGFLGRLLGEWFAGSARVHASRDIAQTLRARGVRCPAVAFTRVHRGRAGLRRMELATDYLEGARDLDQFLAGRPAPARRRAVLRRAGRLLRDMHEAKLAHADLNLRNLLVDAEEQVWVIDFEGSSWRSQMSPSVRASNLGRLYRSAQKRGHGLGRPTGPSKADLYALLKAYSGEGARRYWIEIVRQQRRWGWRHRLAWAMGGGARRGPGGATPAQAGAGSTDTSRAENGKDQTSS